MSHEIRLLDNRDRSALDQLLARSPDSTMFFRSNLRRAGIVYTGADFSAQYVGLCQGGEILAVAAHYWNGMLLVHEPDWPRHGAPQFVPALAARALAASGREVAGLLGEWTQIVTARAALGFTERPTNMTSRDILFALDLDELRVPALLEQKDARDGGSIRWRHAQPRDIDALVAYRVAYHKETLGSKDHPQLAKNCRKEVLMAMDGDAFALVDGRTDAVLACSYFNARVPDMVQVGGVYTPPELRGRGYGRAVVAGSLLATRSQGVARSILFTGRDNPSAQAAYRALGYQDVGDYGLVIFAD